MVLTMMMTEQPMVVMLDGSLRTDSGIGREWSVAAVVAPVV